MSISFFSIEDPGVNAEWERVAEEIAAGPFSRPGWFRAWAGAFGAHVEVAVSAGSDRSAFLPVVRRSRHLTVPVNQETPEFRIVAADEAARFELLRGLLGWRGGNGVFLKVGRSDADAIRSVAGGRVVEEVMQRSPYLDLVGDSATYERSLSSNFRQGLRRKGRRLRDEGEVTVERHDGRQGLLELLEEGFTVESSQWKAVEGTAIASQPDTKAFYIALSSWAAERGWLRLWFMRLDGRAIAFRLDLITDNVYFHVKGGYDPELARFSPGLLLQHDSVMHAFEQGLARYEFLGADEPYKLNWTKTTRERIAIRTYGKHVRDLGAWAARAVVKPWVVRARSKLQRGES